MSKKDETISLLPFIESEKDGFLLDIPLHDKDARESRGVSNPFQIVENGQNFSIIVKAGLKANNSDCFKSLFLLTQRDRYPLLPDALARFTNAGIDRIWYETMLSYSTDSRPLDAFSNGKEAFTLPGQLGRDGRAKPFTSLFFCKKIKKFFHPPCPQCGEPLELCQSDELLIESALPPYSTSLKRYLFCPACFAAGGRPKFYQFSHASDDPVYTKDRFELIKDFSRVKSTQMTGFPCLDCPGHAQCYVTGEKAGSFLGFFSFYPFHMLFFDAQPVKAVDFLPLISGASFEEANAAAVAGSHPGSHMDWEKHLASGKGSDFFFREDERFGLEVLFLKLSFFEAFVRLLHQRLEKKIFSLVNLSIHSIWIRPRAKGSILPFFWDFNLSIIDLIANTSGNYIESLKTRNLSSHFLGSLWFYVFLVNRDQGRDTVYETLGRLAEKSLEDPVFLDYNELAQAFPSAAMENIFWNPQSGSISQKRHEIWLKIIVAGLGFFDTGRDQSLKENLGQFIGIIETLKQDIQKDLFSRRLETTGPFQDKAPDIVEPDIVESAESVVSVQSMETMESSEPQSGEEMNSESLGRERRAISRILRQLRAEWAARDTTAEACPTQATSVEASLRETASLKAHLTGAPAIEAGPEESRLEKSRLEKSRLEESGSDEVGSEAANTDKAPPNEDGDVLETIVLSSPDEEIHQEVQEIQEKSEPESNVEQESRTRPKETMPQVEDTQSAETGPSPMADVDATPPAPGHPLAADVDQAPDVGFDDFMEKTMILPGAAMESVPEKGFDDMEKTVILSPGSPGEKEQKNQGFFGEEDDLDKTMVIPPKK